jgi:tetratricopeptide (TPR) repeat protein
MDASKWLDAANNGTAMMIFPFREETVQVMEWARRQMPNWKPTYYLALIESFRNNKKVAKELMEGVSENVDFAPFYITRAMLYDSLEADRKLSDLSKAVSLDKDEWRYRKYLASYFLEHKENGKAVQTLKPYFKAHPNNYTIGILYSLCLVLNDQFSESENILANIHSLPGEGNTTARELYAQTKLLLALESLRKHNYKTALQKVEEAGMWPRNLGIGKPYTNLINTEMEDSVRRLITAAMNNNNAPTEYEKYALRIKSIARNDKLF